MLIFNPGCVELDPADRIVRGEPFFIVLDSMGGDQTDAVKHLRHYLKNEFKAKRKRVADDALFLSNKRMAAKTPEIPQQQNDCDCALYLLHYLELIFKEPLKFAWLKQCMNGSWFKEKDVANKREDIAAMIRHIAIKSAHNIDFPKLKFAAAANNDNKKKNLQKGIRTSNRIKKIEAKGEREEVKEKSTAETESSFQAESVKNEVVENEAAVESSVGDDDVVKVELFAEEADEEEEMEKLEIHEDDSSEDEEDLPPSQRIEDSSQDEVPKVRRRRRDDDGDEDDVSELFKDPPPEPKRQKTPLDVTVTKRVKRSKDAKNDDKTTSKGDSSHLLTPTPDDPVDDESPPSSLDKTNPFFNNGRKSARRSPEFVNTKLGHTQAAGQTRRQNGNQADNIKHQNPFLKPRFYGPVKSWLSSTSKRA